MLTSSLTTENQARGIDLASGVWRFIAVAIALVSTVLLLRARASNEIIPVRETFLSFPNQLGNWQGSDLTISSEVRNVLGPGDFLFRNYRNESNNGPEVNLFVAYFPSQRAGDTIHSPKNCLPGAGWFPIETSRVHISVPGRASLEVNRYLVAQGERRELVLYWYWAHNRSTASEFRAKLYLMSDAIRMNRSDGSMVRVMTELQPQESTFAAQDRVVSLLTEAVPALAPYIPR